MTRPTGNFSESNTYGQHYSESARIGENNAVTISESSTPKSFTFTAGDESDISEQADVTISNGTTTSASETITVELYDGVDTTGTKIDSESKSVSVSATSSKVVTFIARRNPLDAGDYHINVTQSGTTLSIDQTDLTTTGGEYTLDEDDTGDLVLSDHDNVERGRFPSIGGGFETDTINNTVRFVSPSDSDLQTALNTVRDSGGGIVFLEPGTHSNHSYPIHMPNNVSLRGVSRGSGDAGTSATLSTVLDAGGGLAIEKTNSVGKNFHLRDFSVKGTVRIACTDYQREFSIRDLLCYRSDSSLDTGRGIEIRGTAYQYSTYNIGGWKCDGAAIWIEHDGQALIQKSYSASCGTVVDGTQQYYSSQGGGGGGGTYVRPYSAQNNNPPELGTDGITFDGIFRPSIYGMMVERNDRNIVFTGASGKCDSPVIYGGQSQSAEGKGFVAGEGSNKKTIGLSLEGMRFSSNPTDIDLQGNSQRSYVGTVHGPTSGGYSIGNVSTSNSGFRNTIDTMNHIMADDATTDVSTVAGKFFREVVYNDGSANTHPIGPYWWDGNSWHSFSDPTVDVTP